MNRLSSRLTYANVMATVAVFIALGGASYAAVVLPKNSVGSKQIKNGQIKTADLANNAVTSPKVKDGSLLSADFAPGQLVAGAPGATGAQGLKGDKGDPGTNGTNGTDLTFDQDLASGKTLTGLYGAGGGGASGYGVDAITFRPRLPAAVPSTNVHYITGTSGANCPGDGSAAAGHMCLYETFSSGATFTSVFQGSSTTPGAGKQGMFLYFSTTAATSNIWGTWAYTAP
jgi:hypothetical protein